MNEGKASASRIVVVTAAVAATVSVFAALGGVGLAHSAISLAQYQYGKHTDGKITICHKQHTTIAIAVRAWPAHQRHGDVTGACAPAVKAHANRGSHGHSGNGEHGKGSSDTPTDAGQQTSEAQSDTSHSGRGHSDDHVDQGGHHK